METNRTYKFLLLLSMFSVACGPCCAQHRFQHYTKKNGLGSTQATSMVQDSLGFIWFSHMDGFSRFDGYNSKLYKYDPNNPKRKQLNLFSELSSDAYGQITLHGAKDAVLRYNWRTDAFDLDTLYLGPEGHRLGTMIEPNGKKAWVGYFQKGLYHVDTKSGSYVNYPNSHPNREWELLQSDIQAIMDLGESLLLGTTRGLWLFSKLTKKYSRPPMNPKDTAWAYASDFQALKRSTGNTFWISFRGPHRMDMKTGYPVPVATSGEEAFDKITNWVKINGAFQVVSRFKLPEGQDVGDWTFDDQDVFWFATSANGLLRLDAKSGSWQHVRHDQGNPSSLSSDHIVFVSFDREMNLWVGTDKGVDLLKKRVLDVQNTEIGSGQLDGSVIVALKSHDILLLGKRTKRMLSVENPNVIVKANLSDRPTTFLFEIVTEPVAAYANSFIFPGKHYLWVTSTGFGVNGYKIDYNSGAIVPKPAKEYKVIPGNINSFENRLLQGVQEDTNGDLWVGSKKMGMYLVSSTTPYGKEGSVLNFRHADGDSGSVQNNWVFAFSPENDSLIWVHGIRGLDLLHWNSKRRSGWFEHVANESISAYPLYRASKDTLLVPAEEGLFQIVKRNGRYLFDSRPLWSKSNVMAVERDNGERWWLYTSEGLVLFDPVAKSGIVFNEDDGINHFHSDFGKLLRTRTGLLVMVDADGVSMLDPMSLPTVASPVQPSLVSLSINNRRVVGQNIPDDDSFETDGDITVLSELRLDYLHNNFAVEFSALELANPEKNLYRHRLDGYDEAWIDSDYRIRTATYTNLDPGTYTFRVKATNQFGVWSDKERTLKIVILPPPWRTWWAYTGYSLLAVGLLLLARRSIVQRERLKASLSLEKVEREKEHFELEKAKEVDRVKTSFFTNISHEFRTPLTLIKGPVDSMLDRYKDDPEAVKRLKLVQRNSELLLRLINQLLDLAKLESGSLKVEKSAGEVHGFVRAIASGFDSHARQRGVTLSVEVPAEPANVLFDKDKVETILINLVNNAIKFTPQGGRVTVEATCGELTAKTPRREGSLRIAVADTGIGIPSDQRDKVFERFHQVSESHKEVGTGIGLALVKELVNLMGGTITVESELGKGSSFAVTLPVEEAVLAEAEQQGVIEERPTDYRSPITDHLSPGNQHPVPSTNGTEGESSSKPQVLVVEDNVDVRAFIIDSLGEEFSYLEAENGKQGLDKATSEIPDLIISDVMMPEMDGITMAGRIKEDRNTSHIPLILLTAKSTEESKLSGLSSGADDYLTKPFNKQELLLKVRNSINRQNKLKELLRSQLLTEAPKEKVLSQDEQFLQKVKETIVAQMSDEQLSVESLADDMGMSRVQLYRKVSALTGMAVNELIRKLRLQRAAQLLGQNWGPVSQVAYEVGFSNLSYFSKVFKEEFGTLPSEYEGFN
jgi:signal transduction histidine kinase/DNA-binding response OmpR family regulator/ligand-binding sensor domain-containing protein